MTGIDRRTFFGAAGVLAVASSRVWAFAPTDRIRIGIIGVRGRGNELAQEFSKNSGAEVVALCDVDSGVFDKPVKTVEKNTGKAPRIEKDFRRLLDDKTIDAVAVAAPNHWHALMTVMACQAGKDVYCEKPASYNIVEGRRMVEAARKYNRIVQIGTQRRSMPHVQDAVARVHAGEIGKVGLARAWIIKKRESIGHGTPGPVPAGVDYDMWQGPAPDRPFMSNRFHYNWHWFWNWGNGEIGNNGPHGLDVARWGLNVDAPLAVTSGGGKFVFDDDQEVPDTQIVTYEFANSCLVWEQRMWSGHNLENMGFGIGFYGDKATMFVDINSWRIEPEGGGKPIIGPKSSGTAAPHVQNFLDCVRSREKPNADVEIGHLSTRLCHLGNIAQRTGRKLAFDASSETCGNDKEANALLSREYSRRFEMPSHV